MKYLPHIFTVVVLIVAGVFLWNKYGPRPTPLAPPASGEVPVTVEPNVTHGDPVLPKPDEHTTGVVRIIIQPDTTSPNPGKPREIFVYINEDPKTPPQVRSDTPIQVAFSPVVDPWLLLEVHLMVGVSGSIDGTVSPLAGISGVRLFRKVNLGIGLDRTALGAFASFEVFREFNLGAMYYLLPIRDTNTRIGVFLTYRF